MLITYNGISLPYSDTSEFLEEAVYDDFSKTDRIASRFTITAKFLIHMTYARLISPSLTFGMDPNSSPVEIVQRIVKDLTVPRKALSVKFNGIEMIPNPTGGAGTVDVMNGPQPQYCKYLQLTNDVFVVEYKIIAHYVQNFDPGKQTTKSGTNFLYNKWEETVEIQEDGYTKRTRNGEFKIRSDNPEGLTADMFRSQMAVISVPATFVRESSKYSVSPDGLTLKYTIVDREAFRLPPDPAYKAEGRYVESGRGLNAAIRKADCYVKLTGPRYANQAELLYKAIQIAAVKLKVAGADLTELPKNQVVNPAPNAPPAPPWAVAINAAAAAGRAAVEIVKGSPVTVKNSDRAILEQFDTTVDLYKNVAEVRIIARFIGTKRKRKSIKDLQENVTPVLYSPMPSGGDQPIYRDRGSAGLLLLAASYFDNTLEAKLGVQRHAVPDNEQTQIGINRVELSRGLNPGEAGKNKEV